MARRESLKAYGGKVSNVTWQTIPDINHTLRKKTQTGLHYCNVA